MRPLLAPPRGLRAKPARHLLALALTGALCAPVMGCLSDIGPSSCDRSKDNNVPVRYKEGTLENGVYMTASWACESPDSQASDCELLYFPGGMRYQIEHRLGTVPRYWAAYLSFSQFGKDASGDPDDPERGTLAPAAGNQVELIQMDAETITVVNGSCSDYWLLLVAGAGDVPPAGPAGAGGGGAGGAGGASP